MFELLIKNIKNKILFIINGAFYNFLVEILLPRLLSPSSIGMHAYINSIFTTVERIKFLILQTPSIQSKYDDKEVIENYFLVSAILEGLFFLCVYIYFLLNSYDFSITIIILKLAISACNLLNSLYLISLSRHFEQFKLYKYISISKYISFAFTILFIYGGHDLLSLFIGEFLFQLILFSFTFYKYNFKFRFKYNYGLIRIFFRHGFILWLIDWAPILTITFFSIYIGKNFGSEILGIYLKAILYLSIPTIYLMQNLIGLLVPMVSKFNKEGISPDKIISIYYPLILNATAFIGLILLALSNSLIPLLWGDEWLGVIDLLDYLVLIVFFFPLATINFEILIINSNYRAQIIIRFIQPAIQWLIILFLIEFHHNSFNYIILAFTLGWAAIGIITSIFIASIYKYHLLFSTILGLLFYGCFIILYYFKLSQLYFSILLILYLIYLFYLITDFVKIRNDFKD